jgi:hypothetical protein
MSLHDPVFVVCGLAVPDNNDFLWHRTYYTMDNMRMTPRGRLGFLTYIAVIVLLFAGGVSRLPKNADFSEVLRLILPVSPTGTAPSAPAGTVKITKVIDGDTVETEDGKK